MLRLIADRWLTLISVVYGYHHRWLLGLPLLLSPASSSSPALLLGRFRAVGSTLLVAGLAGALACGGGGRNDALPEVVRLIGEPRGLLRDDLSGEGVAVLDGLVGAAGWLPMGPGDAWRVEEGLLIIESAGPSFDLERPVDVDAAQLHSLEVTLASGYRVGLSLSWQTRDEAEWSEPGLSQNYDDGRGGRHRRTFTFDFRSAAGWTGSVNRLRLRLKPARQDERIVVKRLRGLRWDLPREILEKQSRVPWQIELDREIRKSLVVPPGQPVLREVLVPVGGSLEFGVGASGRLATPITFRVSAVGPHDAPHPLFETVLLPVENAAARRWQEARVDLGAFAGERIRLRAESLVDEGFDPTLGVPVWANPEIVPAGRAAGRPNIILISVDTLRADHLSLYGYELASSPRIDSWARRFAVTFRNTVAQAPWTLPSHCSMLTGVDTLRHGVNHPFEAAPAELTTLAERLSREGYFTAGITGGGWLHPRYGLADGYDRYRYWIGERRGAEELTAHAAIASGWLDQLREPFFLFLHSYDVHDFNAPERMDPVGSEDPGSHLVRHYDRAVSHMDDLLGGFLDRVAASGLRGRTVLALTSDHGEDLGEEGVFGHGSLRDQVLLVPLILELPDGRGAGARIDEQVRSIDIAPTLLDLAGSESPPRLDGVSLRGLVDGGFGDVPPMAMSYFALEHGLALRFRNRWKYLYDSSAWKPAAGREALYRLPGGESRDRDNRAPGDPRSARLRLLARRLLDERLAGLELRFENNLAVPFTGTLRGELIDTGAPRTFAEEGAYLARVAADAAEFSIPPGRQLRLLFEHLGEPGIEIEARGGETNPLEVDLETVDLPATFRWTGADWTRGAVGDAETVGVTIEWRHGGGLEDAAPHTQDPELRRQLEALGYLQ